MSIAEKLTTIAENQQAVYQAGYNKGEGDAGAGAYQVGYETGHAQGYDDGHEDGVEVGKQAEYDRFWDAYQQNGNLRNYDCAFGYGGWNETIYNPKYDIITEGDAAARQTFYAAKWLVDTKVPIYINRGRLVMTFYQATALKTIPYLYIAEVVNGYNNPFSNCTALENITLDGVITMSISFAQSAKLTRVSIESIITHLSDTATGQTLTLSKTAVTNAFGGTTVDEWTSLVNGKSNWTISLV